MNQTLFMKSPKHKFYPERPSNLSAEFARSEYRKLTKRTDEAEASANATKWLKLFADWNALTAYINGEGSRINYNFSCHMDNPQFEQAEEYYREKIMPITDEPHHQLINAFLTSKHRPAITRKYGRQLTTVYRAEHISVDPANIDLRIKERRLTTKYDKLKGSAQVTVDGEAMTLAKAASLTESPKEELRKEAWLAGRQWYLENQSQFAQIFSKLVDLRAGMARNVGHRTYTSMAYEIHQRSDYGREEVEEFRSGVKKYLVPIKLALAKQQAEALGKKLTKPWDNYDPRFTLPLGIAPVKEQLAKTQAFFGELSPLLGQHFQKIRDEKLIDLESRPGKQTNPFCTAFVDTGEVAILCSSTGRSEDITTLIHESGHAFQGLESAHIQAVDLQWGTADLAEIPSTAMEHLSLPRIEMFFSKAHADKYRQSHLISSVNSLCYVCLVDEFQHWIYDNPAATPGARDKKWVELADSYLGPVDYKGYEQYLHLRWYAQMHIFDIPFYYIDYALAEICAMQIAMIDGRDHQKAMDIYMSLCRLGGTKSFLSALKHVELHSPFDESLIKELAGQISHTLNLN